MPFVPHPDRDPQSAGSSRPFWPLLLVPFLALLSPLRGQDQAQGGAAPQAAGSEVSASEGATTNAATDSAGEDAPDEDTVRKLPEEPGVQEQIDSVFGKLVGWVAYLPFYNIAPSLGFSDAPQRRTDAAGTEAPDSFGLRSPGSQVQMLRFTEDSQHLLTVDTERRVSVWTVQGPNVRQSPDATVKRFAKPRVLRDLGVQSANVTAVAANPALGPGIGGEVAVGLDDGSVLLFRIVKPEDGQDPGMAWRRFELPKAPGPITLLAWSADGALFASGSRGTGAGEGLLRLHDAQGEVTTSFDGLDQGVGQIAFGPGNAETGDTFLAALDLGGGLHLLRSSGTRVRPVPASEGSFTALWGLPDGLGYALLDSDGALVLYGADSTAEQLAKKPVADPGQQVQLDVSAHEEGVQLVTTSETGRRFALVLREDGSQRAPDDSPEPVKGLEAVYGGLQLSPLGTYLTEDPSKNRISLRYTGDGGTVHPLEAGERQPMLAALSPDGSRSAVAYDDGSVLLWEWLVRDPGGNLVKISIPVVVLWLVIGAVIFTLMFRFVNIRMFRHAIAVVSGRYTDPNDEGEVSHFQALASALSATVGLGNIAGVAIAISIGGPGATFWMIVAGLLGMSLKFTECTLGQRFRVIDEFGQVSGGPMHYLESGMKKRGLAFLGAPLAAIFTVFCIGGSLAGGNAFQVNQSLGILRGKVEFFDNHPYVYGLIMAVLAGIVIIGGIRRIASTAEKIVPTMCTVYVLSALAILFTNISEVPNAFGEIFGGALSGDAVYGGALGALVTGFRRAAFSNEAGVGSAAIAHSAAKTPYAVREGIVALLEPFIDTVLVCTMTALVIVITGVYQSPAHSELVVNADGAALTAEAFASVPLFASWFPWVLMTAVILFAFSTMISWSYYGERCWTKVFGHKSSMAYKLVFLGFVVLGSVVTAKNVLEFGDLMILLMAFPNIFGLYFLAGYVRKDLSEYESKLASGEIRPIAGHGGAKAAE